MKSWYVISRTCLLVLAISVSGMLVSYKTAYVGMHSSEVRSDFQRDSRHSKQIKSHKTSLTLSQESSQDASIEPSKSAVGPSWSAIEPSKSAIEPSKSSNESPRPTCQNHSTFHILNYNSKYEINDRIRVLIRARDAMDNPRTSGGDYFRAMIESRKLRAIARSDGEVVDFNNGSYLAEFTLPWPGRVDVKVVLVDSSDAVRVLERMRRMHPNRASYLGTFLTRGVNETTECNVDHVANPEDECDFTDPRSGIPWFCRKPSNDMLTCDDWWRHSSDNREIEKTQLSYIRPGEEEYFQSYKTLISGTNYSFIVEIPKSFTGEMDTVDIYGRYPWQTSWKNLPPCMPTAINKYETFASGYYFRDKWFSTRCRNRHFDTANAMECLRDKSVVIFGDSTSHQLVDKLRLLTETEDTPSVNCTDRSFQKTNNFTLIYKFHGPPRRGDHGEASSCTKRNEVVMIDDLDVLPDVLVVTLGMHFSTHSLDYFKTRMRTVKAAVQRLHRRSPQTVFVLQSVNTLAYQKLSHILLNNEWYLLSLDRVQRAVFSDYPNVAPLNEWDMTVAQLFPDSIHPHKAIAGNMISMLLSYACPL